jgi:hypothetical protein
MIADVAGFSRLMEKNESLTFQRVHRLQEEVTHVKVRDYGGRIIKTTGDGFLAEFPSATEALKCGIDIQRTVVAQESAQPAEDRIRLRIGINVGDVIVDGTDVAGDGVNIAARLESMAPLDGLCISSSVREQIRDVLGVSFEDMGDQTLKNISRPIRAYAVNTAGEIDENPVDSLGGGGGRAGERDGVDTLVVMASPSAPGGGPSWVHANTGKLMIAALIVLLTFAGIYQFLSHPRRHKHLPPATAGDPTASPMASAPAGMPTASADASSAPDSAQAAAQTGASPSAAIKVGDEWRYQVVNFRKQDDGEREVKLVVSSIQGDTIYFGSRNFSTDLSGMNARESNEGRVYAPIDKQIDLPLTVGKHSVGTFQWTNPRNGNAGKVDYTIDVLKMENVTVPAGSFEAFCVERKSRHTTTRKNGAEESGTTIFRYWYVPAVKRTVKSERLESNKRGDMELVERRELQSYRLN